MEEIEVTDFYAYFKQQFVIILQLKFISYCIIFGLILLAFKLKIYLIVRFKYEFMLVNF